MAGRHGGADPGRDQGGPTMLARIGIMRVCTDMLSACSTQTGRSRIGESGSWRGIDDFGACMSAFTLSVPRITTIVPRIEHFKKRPELGGNPRPTARCCTHRAGFSFGRSRQPIADYRFCTAGGNEDDVAGLSIALVHAWVEPLPMRIFFRSRQT
jgi:hypothetical protein